MKKTTRTIVFAFAMMMASTATFAQSNTQNRSLPSTEQMTENRANNIAKQMGLDEKTTKKFVAIFKSEQDDMREFMPKRGSMPPRGERPQWTPAQGNQTSTGERRPARMPQMSDEDKKKMETVREKYNKKYLKILSQEQVTQMRSLQKQERREGFSPRKRQ